MFIGRTALAFDQSAAVAHARLWCKKWRWTSAMLAGTAPIHREFARRGVCPLAVHANVLEAFAKGSSRWRARLLEPHVWSRRTRARSGSDPDLSEPYVMVAAIGWSRSLAASQTAAHHEEHRFAIRQPGMAGYSKGPTRVGDKGGAERSGDTAE